MTTIEHRPIGEIAPEAPPKPSIPYRFLQDGVKIEFIIWAISEVTGVSRMDMVSKSRKRELVLARHMCMWFIEKYELTESLKSTGALFGDRDHSTVIHAKEAISDRLDVDKRFRFFFEQLRHKIEIVIL